MWFRGRLLANNKEGIFPVNYVRVYDNVQMPLDDDGNERTEGAAAQAEADARRVSQAEDAEDAAEDESAAAASASAAAAAAAAATAAAAAAATAAAAPASAAPAAAQPAQPVQQQQQQQQQSVQQSAPAQTAESSGSLAAPASASTSSSSAAAAADPSTPPTPISTNREGRDGSSFQVLLHEAPTVFFTPDDNEFDPSIIALVLRGAKDDTVSPDDLRALHDLYVSSDPELVHRYQVKAHEILAEGAPVMYPSMMEKVMGYLSSNHEDELAPNVPLVSFSKHSLDFALDDGVAPLNRTVEDTIVISNPSVLKAKWAVRMPEQSSSDYTIAVSPTSGSLAKAGRASIKVELTVSRMTNALHFVIPVDVAGGLRHYLAVNLDSEKMVFGVDWDCVEFGVYNGRFLQNARVPQVLIDLQKCLYDNRALDVVGIFRLAADEQEIPGIKKLINQGRFKGVGDVNCISTLIKVYFREMPVPLLNVLPAEKFLNCATEGACVALFETLPEPNKTVFVWLLDMMADVALNHEVNRMGSKAISIVVAPNLFLPDKDEDPMRSLLLSQKTVNFVNHVLTHRLRTLYQMPNI
jgi:hypothetical protein